MKLKATVGGLSEECTDELNKIRLTVLQQVLIPHLKVRSDFTSAEFYIQRCDFADEETHEPFCEVRLSGVSLNKERAIADFSRAREMLQKVYEEVILRHLKRTNKIVFLTVTIMLDAPIDGSTLVEGEMKKVCDPDIN